MRVPDGWTPPQRVEVILMYADGSPPNRLWTVRSDRPLVVPGGNRVMYLAYGPAWHPVPPVYASRVSGLPPGAVVQVAITVDGQGRRVFAQAARLPN